MKEITGNAKHNKKSNFPQKLKTGNKTKTGENEIANKFNKYFADIVHLYQKISVIHRYHLKLF